MSRIQRGIHGVVLLLLGFIPTVSNADDAASQIIDKAIEASGGKANLEKANALTWNETGTVQGNQYKAKCAMQRPGKVRREMEVQIANQATVPIFIVFNGEKGSRKSPPNNQLKAMEADELAEMKEQAWADSLRGLLALKGSDVKLSTGSSINLQGRVAQSVTVKKSGMRDVTLYFDNETGLLVKIERQAKPPQGGGGNLLRLETYFSDHKDVSGVKIPHRVSVHHEEQPYVETQLSDVKVSESLPASTFNG